METKCLGKFMPTRVTGSMKSASLFAWNGKLLCRSQAATGKPLFVIDPVTLEETKE
jgi:hypothetical protein